LAYFVCFGIVLALLPLGGTLSWAEVAPALALQVLVGLTLALGPRLNLPAAGLIGMLAYLTSVALLRDATSPTAGYGPLVLLPVVWASLRGGRKELLISLAGVAAVYLVPTLLIGPPQYPVGGWRAGLLFVVIASVIGLAVRRLVRRVEHLLERLGDLARTDDLTGLPNRRAWHELVKRESALARRSGDPLTVALFDLDHFKYYNDTHGHLAGDRLLLAASSAWRSALRETDTLIRWGGDEFVLLLPNCTLGQATALLERIRSICPTAPFSAGMAESDGGRLPETLLAQADEELYRVKRQRVPGDPATIA
jgi:diguanylate cyclase (GGDEF)-like protein